jgi:hypothetical protein
VLPRGITLMKNEIHLQVSCRLGYVTSFHRKFWDLAQQCLDEAKQLTDPEDLALLRTKYAELKLHSELGKTVPLVKFANGRETDETKKLAREYKDEPETRGGKVKPTEPPPTTPFKLVARKAGTIPDRVAAAYSDAQQAETDARSARTLANLRWIEYFHIVTVENGVNLDEILGIAHKGDQS